ncbi:preprotein translocase subunit SecD [Stackebrandtia albiflava]|uniref:Protein translocase subunit SecD n=1 Tax=Stackebrandtia albiflava TaxID=406432 RepID=A0A562VCW1_9ACTN|nr:protein translocase subunit SecD [Stackebrandtia albiflava]TWJ15667.1 preprotein translocase subunit SecD [Stackebrandtia albiflava]
MARRRKGLARKQLRVAPYFIALLALTGLLWLSAFAGVGFKSFPMPKLGLDLQGGMSMVLSAELPDGGTPDAESMEQARQIIEDRVNGTGVAEPEIYVEGTNNIVVNVAGDQTDADQLREVGAPAELRFRQVLQGPLPDYTLQDPADFEDEPNDGAEDGESGDESGDASESPSADGSESPSADGSETPSADSSESPSGEASVSPSGDASESPSGEPSESPSEPAAEDPAETNPDIEQRREEVRAKIGEDVWAMAESLVASGTPVPTDQLAVYMQALAPFGELLGEEVAVLSPEMQFFIPTIGCGQLTGRPAGSISPMDQQVVACDRATPEEVAAAEESGQSPYGKYLLAPSTVEGRDVSTAAMQQDQQSPGAWAVGLTFTNDGQDRWMTLANEAVNTQVAVVLDNVVVTAPTIQPGAANGGTVEITGGFTSDQARLLAEQLNYGSLPLAFDVETIDTVSATLGLDQMEAGLLAGGIGVALVILYCLAYYRFLGVIVILSLIVSGALLYPAIAMLGEQIGFTLTLAGIAGFIVAIGITADSFVVFFERLKDEMKEGRSPRSAVPRAWVRARRTIMSANAVSILAAIVLYFLAIGAVKGFAFTLGLSTVMDIAVVFLFTHPVVSWLSRRGRILSSSRLSGLYSGTAIRVQPSRRAVTRPKES